MQVRRLDRASLRSISVCSRILPSEGPRRRSALFQIFSSYPPTACGLATFTAALASGISAHGTEVGIVRVDTAGQTPRGERSSASW